MEVSTDCSDIKEGDVVEVFQATCKRWTVDNYTGLVGHVIRIFRIDLRTRIDLTIDSYTLVTVKVADKGKGLESWKILVALCDVRRV